ncbi:hypothetical protein [Paenibacillus sp. SAF-068]|uniref:hypothetical protein n=1 Tax=Paenibacillus sp. SAF-068 TaxID=3436864 RepID=UPI003F7F67E4
MATVGDILTAPDVGWKRIEENNPSITYVGSWSRQTNSSASSGYYQRMTSPNGSFKFSFFGERLRILVATFYVSEKIRVRLDEVETVLDMPTPTSDRKQVIFFEKLNLTKKTHTLEVICDHPDNTQHDFYLDAIDVAVEVGDQLSVPDVGWKRYDNDTAIKYSNHFWKSATANASNYGVAGLYTADDDAKIQFLFRGTKIRVIQRTYSDERTVNISIDGVKESFEPKSWGNNYQILVYEKQGLSDEIHKVEFTFVNDNTNSAGFDAIDIDYNGRLFHPDEVTNIAELEIGKRIRCNYAATISGAFGVFKNIGAETDSLIPTSVTLPAVQKGDFYFIMADEYNGKKILIADRNIQNTISWDTLNSNGLVSGVTLDMNHEGYSFTFRLLTGGINSADVDNEWNKHIVNSTLNGSIVAGDNNVWGWSTAYSWTSTTIANNSANRIRRGRSTAVLVGSVASSTADLINGFRPLVELETLPMFKSFVNHKGSYKRFEAGTPELPERHASIDSVPPMTSSNTPSGFASASGYFSTSEAWQAFSDKPSGSMVWISNARTGWICYRFDVPIVITKYTILPPSDNTSALTRSPKDWILEASNDSTNGSDGTWVTLDIVTGTTGWEMDKKKEFTFSNINSYISYRIRVTLNSGDSSYVSIWQIELMEGILSVPAIPSMWNTISATLPSEDTFINDGMDDLSVLDRKKEDFIQNMTANGSIGSGKLFKGSMDLKKYSEITSVNVK